MRSRNNMVLPEKPGASASINRRTRSKKNSFKRLAIVTFVSITILYTPTRQWFFRSLLKVISKGVIPVEISNTDDGKCTFRNYDPPRHYNLNIDGSLANQPAFLSDAKYVRGALPVVINPGREGLKKICADTSEWETMDSDTDQRWPFSDGQNPSFVSLRDDAYAIGHGSTATAKQSRRIGSDTIKVLDHIYGQHEVQDMYIGLLLFGDSQCRWNMTPTQLGQQGYSLLLKAPSIRTVVVVMDRHRNPVGDAVLELLQDAVWGTKRKKIPRKTRTPMPDDATCAMKGKENEGCFDRAIVQLDDARFFFHAGLLHVLFRNGPSFGYEAQVQHPVHIKAAGDGKFEAYIKASEMFEVCCGRNIAFISEIPNGDTDVGNQSKEKHESPANGRSDLFALTWVDPVTVIAVSTPNNPSSTTDTAVSPDSIKRRLRNKKEKSHIHGTNGYLLPLHSTSELLGVAHFHRPENRDKNTYARFGHHYTHAFFTLQRKEKGENSDGEEGPKFALKRLSNEFIFESPSSDVSDGDIIQFASGLDLVGSDTEGKLLISYGINDCESASFFLDMDHVQGLLRDVKDGDEVVNLMEEIQIIK